MDSSDGDLTLVGVGAVVGITRSFVRAQAVNYNRNLSLNGLKTKP
jgi:hypothetical protein